MTPNNSNVAVCVSQGDLLSTTVKAFREKVDQVMATQASNPQWNVLELDLRAARFIDSVGINLIILMIRKMKDRNGSVRVRLSSNSLKRVLDYMRVNDHAEIILES